VYREVEQPVAREVEALQGSSERPGRDGEAGCLQYDGSRAGLAGAPGSKVGDRSLKEWERIPLGSTSMNLIAFESVSMPLGREVGVVEDGGEKIREEAVGEGRSPDASDTPGTPGILMVDETRRSMGSLAN